MNKRQYLWRILGIVCLLAGLFTLGILRWQKADMDTAEPQELMPIAASGPTRDTYDVIVAGTDPEGIMAAVSAARNDLRVLLVDGRDRDIFGGLLTLGWLNSLDLNKSPRQHWLGKLQFLNKGLFQEWYDQIEGTSFDVVTAANAFNRMVSAEPNIEVLMKVRSMEPVMEGQRVIGLRVVKEDGSAAVFRAQALIDATQDGDIAAAAGAPYTFGREDIGEPDAKMAVTLVFKMKGVTPEIWKSFGRHENTGIDRMSAWGFPEAKNYPSSNPERVKLRGLNIGRQNDGTILINAMHIYGVNPLDPQSVEEGLEIGRREAPRIAEYLKRTFEEFRDLEFAGTAPELYVRESRHIIGEYRLTMADLMENRDHWDAIAYGSYEVDIQSTGPNDPGAILMKPQAYGVPFRCLVPLNVDGLLVVGRAASFHSLPHGSARVVPLGMATGEAAGAAVRLALEHGVSFREMSRSEELIAELRRRLEAQGMDLTMPAVKTPEYMKHPAYSGLLAAVSLGLTYGNYDNQGFALDEPSNPMRFGNMMQRVRKVYPQAFAGNPRPAADGMADAAAQPLSLDQAAYTILLAAGEDVTREQAMDALMSRGWVTPSTLAMIGDPDRLTNGDAFLLLRDVLDLHAGVKFE